MRKILRRQFRLCHEKTLLIAFQLNAKSFSLPRKTIFELP